MPVMSDMFHGVFAPVVTPFVDQRLDLTAFSGNLERYGGTSLRGLVVLGSNGEAALLDDAESDAVLRAARKAIPQTKTFIAGTGRESTRATIDATARAADAGADAVLVRTPSFFKARMTAEALVHHYETIAERATVPVLLYNVTMFTGISLPVEALATLAAHPRIVGIKDSGSDLALVGEFIRQTPPGFTVLSGSAATFYPSLCLGAKGAVLAVAGVVPDLCVRIFELTQQGRHDEAREWQHRLVPLAQAVGSKYGVAGLKAALSRAGYAGGEPRLPLLPLPEQARQEIEAAFASLHATL